MMRFQEPPKEPSESKFVYPKCARKFKLVFGLLTFSAFAYQTTKLVGHYLEYETLITTEYVKPMNVEMPAFTICKPDIFRFRSVFCRKGETKVKCKHRLIREAKAELRRKEKRDIQMSEVKSYHENKQITLIPFKRFFEDNVSIDIDIGKIMVDCRFGQIELRRQFTSVFKKCFQHTKPVISIIYNGKSSESPELCWTFFSRFDQEYREHRINLMEMHNLIAKLKFNFTDSEWDASEYDLEGINFAVHPPNLIPRDTFWVFHRILPGKYYVINYSLSRYWRLKSPYKTNCHNYGDEDKSQSDCITKCIFARSWNTKYECFHQWDILNISQIESDVYLCPIDAKFDDEFSQVRKECDQQCPKSCYQEYYDVWLNVVEQRDCLNNLSQLAHCDLSEVVVKYKTTDNVTVYHKPAMLFQNLVAAFGGLSGFYLSCSLFAFYNYLVRLTVFIVKQAKRLAKVVKIKWGNQDNHCI